MAKQSTSSKDLDGVSGQVRDHFRQGASSFDSLYNDEEATLFNRLLRSGMFERQKPAINEVRRRESPRVLDIGCGSGRVAELLLEAGAGQYVGVDFSEPMLELSRQRLQRYADQISLVQGDFAAAELEGQFDVVVAVGLFDYIEEPYVFTRRMRELSAPGASAVASFPRWTWVKGPLRKIRYEVINKCPIFNYTERELRLLFGGSGYDRVDIQTLYDGYLVTAHVD